MTTFVNEGKVEVVQYAPSPTPQQPYTVFQCAYLSCACTTFAKNERLLLLCRKQRRGPVQQDSLLRMSSPSKIASKRTRKPVGNTNRKQLTGALSPDASANSSDLRSISSTTSFMSSSFSSLSPPPQKTLAPQKSSSSVPRVASPKVRASPSPTKNKFHTTSSEMKTHASDNDTKRKDNENLHKLRCEFVETFEAGKSNVSTSTNIPHCPYFFASHPFYRTFYRPLVGC